MVAAPRVFGAHSSLADAGETFVGRKVERVWRVGEPTRGGKRSETSGFTLLLSEAETSEEMVAATMTALGDLTPHVAELARKGATAEVDFAPLVGAAQMRSIVLDPGFLGMMDRNGIRLVVSAYPVAEERDE